MARYLARCVQSVHPEKPDRLRHRFRRLACPARLGTLHRTTPLSNHYGYDRGTPVDRYFIERFLREHYRDMHGRVLEVKDTEYTHRYGVGVEQHDVLDIDPSNPNATFVTDLAEAAMIPSDLFDCFVLTQTLQFIYDTRAAIAESYRILRPGGILLVTVPGISRVDPQLKKTDHWRFTVASCLLLFGEIFGAEQVTVQPYGNVLTAIAFLIGMAREELSPKELDTIDEHFPLILGIRAVKR